jgi:hypothetical protein
MLDRWAGQRFTPLQRELAAIVLIVVAFWAVVAYIAKRQLRLARHRRSFAQTIDALEDVR